MKKQHLKNLKLGKSTISNVGISTVKGGATTTNQSQYCPVPIPLPDTIQAPLPVTHDTIICTLNTYTRFVSGCKC
ncbi:hypothetical protein H2O64_05040 [Kordia sp. YSTF-M3]|uniref:Uncharacterized protein n=1 Tax=Kordia aestuariivivens TaxID=2759037 RepID=A0ABR7Q639_9FLAO|nr:hypothetical protein [Kordia aestuariivivens]MBC8754025.1 hypothetical protein [Kordia aestuariivivens]